MSNMPIAPGSPPITAVVYEDARAFEVRLQETARAISEAGLRLAGLVQHSGSRPDRARCDMDLLDLSTGSFHPISEDRGASARGCTLDTDRLLQACVAAGTGVCEQTDLLVLSKFGKAEVQGGGARMLLEQALELGIPVLIGVPAINLAPFRAYAGDLAREITMDALGAEAGRLCRVGAEA